jgi:hypothetical protein
MKYFIAALSLALIVGPAAVSAQTAPSAPPSGASGHRWGGNPAFAAFFKQEESNRKKFRTQVLSAVSSSHRAAIGNIIGSLAVSTNPDPRTAAQRIDSLLSQSERQTILSARDSFEQSSRALRDQMRAKMAQQMNTSMPSPPPHPKWTPSNDAGRIVMMALSPFGPGFGMHGGRGMGGPGMMPPGAPPPNGQPPSGPPPGGGPPQP